MIRKENVRWKEMQKFCTKGNNIIYIRVDANEHIAMGHLMRTLTIAEAVRVKGGECCFITADHQGHKKIEEKGFSVICLETVWDDLDGEIEIMEQLVRDKDIRCLLLDSYYVTRKYMEKLSNMTCLVYIDDLKAFTYSCNTIVNYMIGEKGEEYTDFPGELCLGPEYAPVRAEFYEPHILVNDDLKRVMVTTGGADKYHFGVQFLKIFLADERFTDCEISMVVGSKSHDKDYILAAYSEQKRVNVHVDVANMGQLMKQADCIVSAGGTTLYEACACKTPAVSYAVADNQITNVLRFHDMCALYYAGDVRESMDLVVEKIMDRIEYMKPSHIRKQIASKMGEVVDGKGASRIADRLMKLLEE